MPAVVSRTDGSCSAGTSEPDASRRWSRLSKKLRKRSRISTDVMAPRSLGARDGSPADDHVASEQLGGLAGRRAVERLLQRERDAVVAPLHAAGHGAGVVAQAHRVDLVIGPVQARAADSNSVG